MTEPISDKKKKALEAAFLKFNILEKDLSETFTTGAGKGGQKQNKTNNCVTLKHLPTGIVIKNQKSRSRENNRFFARRELAEKIEKQITGVSKDDKIREKIKKQKKRRKRRTKDTNISPST